MDVKHLDMHLILFNYNRAVRKVYERRCDHVITEHNYVTV